MQVALWKFAGDSHFGSRVFPRRMFFRRGKGYGEAVLLATILRQRGMMFLFSVRHPAFGEWNEEPMKPRLIGRPDSSEYASYQAGYVALVEGDDILSTLEQQRRDTILLLSCRDENDGNIRYAPGKWTAKEVLAHVNDCERIFAYRALRIARGDKTPLAGFEQDDYIRDGAFGRYALSDLIEDFIAVRRATVSLLRNLDETAWMRRGVANNKEITVRALAFVIAGHELHHRKILKDQYFTTTRLSA
jgi:uncharacterized damage-inducible protein DinB